MPKISIIMPVYNKQDYLKRSLDSVLGQDFPDYELITIDDGSTDNSLQILEEYRKKDLRIKTIHTENCGVSHARNIGLDSANGEYLTFFDADDELKHGYLSSLYKTLMENNVDMVIQGVTKVYPDGRIKELFEETKDGRFEFTEVLPEFSSMQKRTGIFGYCVSKLFARNLAEDIRFDESLALAEDFDFYLKLYRKIKTIYFARCSYYLYNQNLVGSSVDILDEDIDYVSQFKLNLRYRDFLKEMSVYNGNNKEIVEQTISSCGYHMVLFSTKKEFSDRFDLIRENVSENSLPAGSFKSRVLQSVLGGNKLKTRLMITVYKTARAVKRILQWSN